MRPFQSARYECSKTPVASATNAITASIDVSGASSVTIIVPVSIEANTNSTNVILDVLASDDTVVTNHVSLGTTLIDNTAAHVGVYNVANLRKRWIRVTATPDTSTNGAVIFGGIIAVKQVTISPTASTTSSLATVGN